MEEIKSVSENQLYVESAWEVCWQLGGIYTVLRTKAPAMVERWGDRYCLVGPYNQAAALVEMEPLPLEGPFGRACALLEERGFKVHFGRWLISGRPQVVLIDFLQRFDLLKESKYLLWKDHAIETVEDREVNDVILFGYQVVEFFEALVETMRDEGDPLPILAHFHEWMAGVPIPVLRHRKLPVATVFTTHATLLGRYLASNDTNFYNYLSWIDPHGAATSRGIYPRFAIERAAAHGADTFTTVSAITNSEAEQFLGRSADVLVPNGLNVQRFAALHEFQNLHARYKDRIHDFVMGHFFPSYTFNLDKTFYVFTSGRYEYTNKGMDLFIEGLARLNYLLKSNPQSAGITVVAFIITKAATKGYNVDALSNQKMFNELTKINEHITEEIDRRMLQTTAMGRLPLLDDLLTDYDQLRLKRMIHAFKKEEWQWPLITTHDLQDDVGDPVINRLRTCKLYNSPHDPVKVVYHPDFLKSTSPLIGLDYEQFVRGCHLGVFPSYYEPWGYTPMECTLLGVPSITTDLAGFGTYLMANLEKHDENGLFLLERRHRSFWESADLLAEQMKHVVTMSRRERIELRNRVERQSELFDWKELSHNYDAAHRHALEAYSSRS